MFKVRVIPCLDVKDGRVVKGVRFLDLRDAGDPVEAAVAIVIYERLSASTRRPTRNREGSLGRSASRCARPPASTRRSRPCWR